jgi:hypothetical protein
MNIEATPSASGRMRAAPRQCCEDCPSGARNNYFIGKRMPPQSYQAEQRFLNGRRQLINRAVLGWGVVYGFELAQVKGARPGDQDLTIGEGLALDVVGRELWQPEAVSLTLDNLLVLDADGKPIRVDGDLNARFVNLTIDDNTCWLLSAHYAEQALDPVTLKDDCNCDRKEWDRTCETIVYSIRQIDCADCCAPYTCELACDCPPDSDCCGHENTPQAYQDGLTDEQYQQEIVKAREAYDACNKAANGDQTALEKCKRDLSDLLQKLKEAHVPVKVPIPPARKKPQHARGGCMCLCEHLTELKIGADCVRLRDVGDCTRADLDHGISLACLALGKDDCGDWTIARITDACGPRRLVKRNDLLFDLINGCDVTRIEDTGWKDWHRVRDDADPVPFDDFAAAFGWAAGDDDNTLEYVTSGFWVQFSRSVRVASLKPDCFAIGIMTEQTEGCWREYYRVPIVGVVTDDDSGNPMLTKRATIVVAGDWVSDGLVGRGSIFHAGPTYVEITVRGDFIVDCMGQTVDANPPGLLPVSTGSDGPGDDYISTFTVAQRVAPAPPVTTAATRRRVAPANAQGVTS